MKKQKGIIKESILRKIDELRDKVELNDPSRNVDTLLDVSSNLDKCLFKWSEE